MVRFVASPDGDIFPDVTNKLPGRGVWLTAQRSALETAVKRDAFSRSLKRKVATDPGIAAHVEALLLKRCQGLLGMAKRSGDIILGFDQVRAALRKRRPACLLEASDGAQDGRQKVYALAKALYGDLNVAGALTSEELGMAFGRTRVIHGALQAGALAAAWSHAYGRLAGFRPAPEDHWFSAGDRKDNPERT